MAQDVSNSSATASAKKPIPWRLIIAGLIALAAVIFVFQNTADGEVKFLWLTISLPFWLLFIILIAVGMIIDRLIIWRSHHSKGE